jgi:lysophospholipase L1-like esterase
MTTKEMIWAIGVLLALCLVAAICGCGSMPAPTKSPEAPSVGFGGPADAPQPPSVVIIGDSIVNSWCASITDHPTWTCQGSPSTTPQETVAEVAARFPAAIALDPQFIVIEAGAWDINGLAPQIGVEPCQTSEDPCASIQTMIQEATAAGIAVIVCTIPPWGNGPSATINPDAEINLQHVADIGDYNQAILASTGATTIDMYTLLALPESTGDDIDDEFVYNTGYTTDGVDPSSDGAQVMTTALQSAITNSGVKGVMQ